MKTHGKELKITSMTEYVCFVIVRPVAELIFFYLWVPLEQ